MSLDQVRWLLERMDGDGHLSVLRMLRQEFGVVIHPLETQWNTGAEAILEAIYQSPDLTQRGVRGVLAEAIFRTVVVPTQLTQWTSEPIFGDLAYDLRLRSPFGPVRVQVKNQRRERGGPKVDMRLSRLNGSPVYVVETQRTRNGQTTGEDGEQRDTRPYRFTDFDVLAVCMQPSSGSWHDFVYCPTYALRPRLYDAGLLHVMQPIVINERGPWTRSFDSAALAALRHIKSSSFSSDLYGF